jgi:hypothetical protein
MKKTLSIISAVVVSITFAISASAQANGNAFGINQLECFSGIADGVQDDVQYGGTCTLSSKGAKNLAVLNTNGGDPDGEYAGVYSNNKFIYSRPLSSLSSLRFSYSGTTPYGGAPRFSIPFDSDGDGVADDTNSDGYTDYLFIQASTCNDGAGNVNGASSACQVDTNFGGPSYPNVAALAAAYPGAAVAADHYLFIIADAPGIWTLSNVNFGGPGNN